MSVRPIVFQTSLPQVIAARPTVTFVIEGEEISFETRFLLPCDYFHAMLTQGMREGQTQRIEVKETTPEIFKNFLNFLKTGQLMCPDYAHTAGLFALAHQYQHEGLLIHMSSRLQQEIPTHFSEVLSLAYFYEHDSLKKECLSYAERNLYQVRDLFARLIEQEEFEVIEGFLEGSKNLLYQIMTYDNGDRYPIFNKLLSKQKYSLATKFLLTAQRLEMNMYYIVPDTEEAIFQLLGNEPPSKEQMDLIVALARNNTSVLCNYSSRHPEPPLHLTLKRDWQVTFNTLLAVSPEDAATRCNQQDETLLSIAISQKNLEALRALKKQIEIRPLSEDEIRKFVKEAVATNISFVVGEVLAFPVRHYYYSSTPQIVDQQIIEQVIDKKNHTILRVIWPHFQGSKDAVAQLRKKAFDQNQLALAEILFHEGFDASTETYPEHRSSRDIPWIHHIVIHGSFEWLNFMLPRCQDLEKGVEMYFKEHGKQALMTPLLLALHQKRDPKFVQALLEEGADWDHGNELFYPLHLVFTYESVELLRTFLEEKPELDVKNHSKQNFFHLFFSARKTLLSNQEISTLITQADPTCLEAKDGLGNTPVHYAVSTQHQEGIFAMLLKKSALLWSSNKDKKTPLHMVSGKLFETTMASLVKTISSLKECQDLKTSLLLWCAQEYLYHFCDELIRGGANVNVRQKDKKTLLHLSAEVGASLAVQKLLGLGIPIDSQDENLQTPLHLAVARRNVKLVRILVQKGASLTLFNANSETPLTLALKELEKNRSQEIEEIVEILEALSCKVQ